MNIERLKETYPNGSYVRLYAMGRNGNVVEGIGILEDIVEEEILSLTRSKEFRLIFGLFVLIENKQIRKVYKGRTPFSMFRGNYYANIRVCCDEFELFKATQQEKQIMCHVWKAFNLTKGKQDIPFYKMLNGIKNISQIRRMREKFRIFALSKQK